MKRYFIVIVFIIALSSCSHKAPEESIDVVESGELLLAKSSYEENGETIFVNYTYKGDTVLHGTLTSHYSNGLLRSKSFFHNGVRLGELLKYDKQGNLVNYSFYDPMGRLRYRRLYEKGELHDEEGEVEIQLVYKGDNSNLKTENLFHLDIYVPTPPDCEVILSTTFMHSETGELMGEKKFKNIENGLLSYKEHITYPAATYLFQVSLEFKDSIRNKVEEDVFTMECVVVE